ncbi:PTS N-acetylglucosamine transporter subunit IIBC [Aerococcus sp. JJEM-2022a]|uniref:PTS N-acetylglucosamine transporter subunit IIBC n=1 Tax=Aerococcus loyolae TaxID=2976809 RepID=A0ABT4BXC9_9LACT|nr:PTS N-acetylglucosamine transporter subunit IIBC [Aerococcus loyolae]MCY3024907.1 PTS N-acetylglucosamine transporter subunit IIBC [Aerococcus loyolae]MCY3028621.1 PTS N-acetylglucosamine transporter subunit IIBC [Aerococcus loyolae]
MRHILIATHSTLAEGFKRAKELLVGTDQELKAICAYIDESDYTNQIDEFFENYDSNSEYIVLTDIFGGSVNQKIVIYKEKYNFRLITGVNLPLLLAIVLSPEPISDEDLLILIKDARESLKIVELDNSNSENEEDFLE